MNKQSFRDLMAYQKISTVPITGLLEEDEQEGRTERLFK
jgi:hypothetical protein